MFAHRKPVKFLRTMNKQDIEFGGGGVLGEHESSYNFDF